jgi:splicing factor 3B subunit 2
MGLSTAERNRQKRERKKQQRLRADNDDETSTRKLLETLEGVTDDVVVEYVPEAVMAGSVAVTSDAAVSDGVEALTAENSSLGGMNETFEALRRFQERAGIASFVSEGEGERETSETLSEREDTALSADGSENPDADVYVDLVERLSKRKLRALIRPDVASLKRTVARPDLVEAHDITAADPEFLIQLKAIPGTVPVPRHWGRKRKYLQGKRGFEKPPFKLPDFIVKTGITQMRDATMQDEASMSIRQKNRARVAPKMKASDVDYRTLYDAFFKHQTKPTNLTKFGDVYYEGKELEIDTKKVATLPGSTISEKLREALGMDDPLSPPPWLQNMQRYGPPPSYRHIPIPGLTAPLPRLGCQYGYHAGGWGKPPLDAYGRPLYGGNPFDPPGSVARNVLSEMSFPPEGIVTSAGKMLHKSPWGALPGETAVVSYDNFDVDEASSSEDNESVDMKDSDDEDEEKPNDDVSVDFDSGIPLPMNSKTTSAVELRKQGMETPVSIRTEKPKQLYHVLEQKSTSNTTQDMTVSGTAVFASEMKYVVPPVAVTDIGVESVLTKIVDPGHPKKDATSGDDEDDDNVDSLGKNFKF